MHKKGLQYAWRSFLFGVGYILSPVSFWNDALINFPLAYAMAYPFTGFVSEGGGFAMLLGIMYMITNIVGFLLMQYGFAPQKTNLRSAMIWSILYTAIVIILSYKGIIPSPQEIINWINA